MLTVPLCPRCLGFIVVAINSTIKTKRGFSVLSKQLPALPTKVFVLDGAGRGPSGTIQTPHFTLLSFLQKRTVQALVCS